MHSLLSSSLLLTALASSVLANPQYGSSGSSGSSSSSSAAAASMTSGSSTGTSSGSSAVHTIQVGPTLAFTPNSVTAAKGDILEFHFGAGHSVTESTFANPCQPVSGAGIFSGFPNDGDIFSVTVNATTPLWLYCAAVGHCQAGMVMAVNAP